MHDVARLSICSMITASLNIIVCQRQSEAACKINISLILACSGSRVRCIRSGSRSDGVHRARLEACCPRIWAKTDWFKLYMRLSTCAVQFCLAFYKCWKVENRKWNYEMEIRTGKSMSALGFRSTAIELCGTGNLIAEYLLSSSYCELQCVRR